MPPKTITGGPELGRAIRARREELSFSIEQAANLASVGTETWRRYEAGGGIRTDKVRGICAALRWRALPGTGEEPGTDDDDLWTTYDPETDDGYSDWLGQRFGIACAKAFDFGSTILLDQAQDDLDELSKMPRGTHIGELSASWLDGLFPAQWVPRYDYEFVYRFRVAVDRLRTRALNPTGWDSLMLALTVGEGIALRLIFEQGDACAELRGSDETREWRDWTDDLTLPDWAIHLMYAGKSSFDESAPYGFDHWFTGTDVDTKTMSAVLG
jgi:hypothetical protein